MQINPAAPRIRELKPEDEVSFVPMEAVGERGGLNLNQSRALADISTGYTGFQDGDVVVAKITPCFENGKGALACGLLNGVAFGTTELHVLRAGELLDHRFLFYITLSDSFRKLGEAEMYGAGGQKRVPPEFNKDFQMPMPPLEEQQLIANFLDWKTDQIDALITKKRELVEKLQEKRMAVITQAVTKGLDPSVPMRDSGIDWLGKVPRHWIVKRLRFVCKSIEQGWSPQCDNQPADDDSWGVMKVGCVNGDVFDEMENKALPIELEPQQQYELRPKDILISRANTRELLGSAAIVPDGVRPKLLLCDKLYRVTASQEVDEEFLTYYLRTPAARFKYEREATGASSSMKNIGQDTIRNLATPLPPLEEQKMITEKIGKSVVLVDNQIRATETALTRLTEYRTALITAATTGKIDVRQVQVGHHA